MLKQGGLCSLWTVGRGSAGPSGLSPHRLPVGNPALTLPYYPRSTNPMRASLLQKVLPSVCPAALLPLGLVCGNVISEHFGQGACVLVLPLRRLPLTCLLEPSTLPLALSLSSHGLSCCLFLTEVSLAALWRGACRWLSCLPDPGRPQVSLRRSPDIESWRVTRRCRHSSREYLSAC